MKVLIGCRAYPPDTIGGGEISTQNLAEALVRDGVDVTVITISDQPQRGTVNGVKIIRLPSLNIYWSGSPRFKSVARKAVWHFVEGYNFTVATQLRRVFAEVAPDIFHTSTVEDLSPYAWKVAKAAGIPVVHTLRSYTLMCPRGTMFKHDKNCTAQCLLCREVSRPKRRLSRYVDQVVGNSDAILQQHLGAGFFPSAGNQVVFNICDADPKLLAARVAHKHLTFGYLGRLHRTKGLELLLQQFQSVSAELDCRLLIAGTGEVAYEKQLRREGAGGRIEFLGQQNAAAFLSAIDVLIVPSLWHEPLPRTIIEACVHGVPVIASTRGGNPEIVHDGQTGFLFDPDHSGALGAAMMHIGSNPGLLPQLREQCLKHAVQFSSSEVSSRYRMVYDKARGLWPLQRQQAHA